MTSSGSTWRSQWLGVTLFAIAFAWVESAVVVYLREIFFDGGFAFPLKVRWEGGQRMVSPLVRIEFVREIATLTMLAAVGWVTGGNRLLRTAYFMLAFGVWDIFYYVWLRVMVGWPQSLMTWDLLFYVPLPWVGPVITPVLIALTMIGAGTLLVWLDAAGRRVVWRWRDTAVELTCALALVVAFCWDWQNILQLPGDERRTGVPNPFAWWLYAPALIAAVLYFIRRVVPAAAGRPAGRAH